MNDMTTGTRLAPKTGMAITVKAALISVLSAVIAGSGAVYAPVLTVAVSGLLLWTLFIYSQRARLPQVFVWSLGILLVGYAFLGRGFAHIGVAPLYVGEAVLSIAAIVIVLRLRSIRLGYLELLLAMFVLWGAFRTLPYVRIYGIDALRDAVIWGYAAIAVAIVVALQPEQVDRLVKSYARLAYIFVLWIPVAILMSMTVGSYIPSIPGSDVSLLTLKGGDVGVHLAGVAGFVLVGLYSAYLTKSRAREHIFWLPWLASVVLVSVLNRGAFLAISTGILLTLVLKPTSRILTAIVAGVAIMIPFLLINPTVDLGNRELSANQIFTNVKSIFSDSEDHHLQGTQEWRLRWWSDIRDYTIFGPYRWTGKGYGVNLASSDGYQVDGLESLRSPHNGHMTILARSGVPGLALWIAFNTAFFVSLFRAAVSAHRNERVTWVQINVWILVYWCAMLVNTSFDVYLEGPQGGIWFWAVIGFGIASLRIQQSQPRITTREADFAGRA